MDSSPRRNNVGVDAGLPGHYRAMASASTPSVLSQSTPTFHNYEPRIVSAHGNNAQRALEMVGVDRDIRIGDEHLKAQPAGFGIGERLNERMTGREALTFELAVDPVEEDFDLRFPPVSG